MLRFLSRLARKSQRPSSARASRRAPRRAHLQLESLEERMVLSTTNPAGLFQPLPLQSIQGVAGQALGAGQNQVDVAFFNSTNPSAANFTATIKWGDGTTSQGTIVKEPARIIHLAGAPPQGGGNQPQVAGAPPLGGGTLSLPGGFEVQGTHTYKQSGNFTISTTITAVTGGHIVLADQAHIQNAPLVPLNAPQLQALAGAAMPQTEVAAFVDTNSFDAPANHSAAINWGDGTTSTGMITAVHGVGAKANQIDHFIVLGSHTYAAAGPFTVTVTIQDTTNPTFGEPLVIQDAMSVKDQPLTAVKLAPVSLVEGNIVPLGMVVGSFKYANPLAQPSDFGTPGVSAGPGLSGGTAQVDFGDGFTGIGSVVADSTHPGVFDVLAPISTLWHAYVAGTYHLQVTVTDRGGSQVVTDTLVHVADAPLILQSTTPVSALTHLPLTGITLGTFVDGATSSPLIQTNETVLINWGDGTRSAGQVVYDGASTYSVVGSHTYVTATGKTPLTVHVDVKDPAGQDLKFTTQATVQDSTTELPGFVKNELEALVTSIDRQLFGQALPLVGTALDQLGDSVVGAFAKAIFDGASAAIGGTMQDVEHAITGDLGQLGQGILKAFTPTSDANGDFSVELHLNGTSTLGTGGVALNLGLPGLPIQFNANAAVTVAVGYDIVLDFGMQAGTPFLQTKADAGNTANPLGVALDINASITPGSTISATLGGLTATLTQPTTISVNPSPVNADIAVRTGPSMNAGGGQSLTGAFGSGGQQDAGNPVHILPPPGQNPAPPSTFIATVDFGFSADTNGGIQLQTPQLSGSANINLQASLSLDGDPALPSITSGLNVVWSFNSADPTQGGLLGNAPAVSFNNVTVDLGSFLTHVVGPVVSAVQKFTAPLAGLANALLTPLPGLKEVCDDLGMKEITVADLLGSQSGPVTTFANVVQAINNFQVPTSGSIAVDVGSFNIADARVANSPATNLAPTAAGQPNGLTGDAGGAASTYSNLQTQADFDFPLFDNPLGFVSSVLMGQKVDLVKANLGVNLSAGFNDNIPLLGIPVIGSINANFYGSVNLDIGATFVLTDGFLVGGSLLNSLQVQNAHVDTNLTFGAGVGVSVFGASASLDVTAGLTFDLALVNSTTGNSTITGSDLLDGNVAFKVSNDTLQVGVRFEVDVFGVTVYQTGDTLISTTL